MAKHSAIDKAVMHSVIAELESQIDGLYLDAINLEMSQGNSDVAESYRLAARALQSRVNVLVYDFGRPAADTFRVESATTAETSPPVDLFKSLRAAVTGDTTQFVTAVGSATK